MNDGQFTRRGLLRRLGAGAALAPFVPLLAEDARAAEARRRLVVMFTPDSPVTSTWDPTGTEYSFTLGSAMKPLEPWKSHLVVLKGLDKVPGRYGDGGPGSAHTKALAHAFTAEPMTRGTFDDFGAGGAKIIGWVDAISVDQFIAQQIAPRARTPFRALTLGALAGTPNPGRRISYQAPGQPVDPDQDPWNAFKRVFAGRGSLGGPDMERLRLERRSVLDVVKRHLGAARGRVGSEDQRKLDAHLQAVREVERRLQEGPAPGSCEVALPSGRLDPAAEANYPKVIDAHMDLIALAFACDLTRVVSLQLSRSGGRIVHRWIGQTQEAHEDGHAAGSDPVARERQHQRAVWYAGRFASLLERLDRISEGGRTVLQNSVLAWNWELSGRPDAHQTLDTPWVLAGSAGGYFKTGRFLEYRDQPHSPLLVSLCHAMGLEQVERFGRPQMTNGSGRVVPVTPGGLPRLAG